MKPLLIATALGALAASAALAQSDLATPALRGDSDTNLTTQAPMESEPEARPLTGAEAEAALAKADAYLNGVQATKGRFVQINPDGSSIEGDLYLQRPGRMRFAYDAPSPLVIIADGRTVAQIDSKLETVDRLMLEETPLSYLLKSDVDLAKDGEVDSVVGGNGQVLITMDDPRDRIPGQLVLVFSDPEFALRGWIAVDQYGQETRVVLNDLTRHASLDPELFRYELDTSSRRPR